MLFRRSRCASPTKPHSHHRFVYCRIPTHSGVISDSMTGPFPLSLVDPSHFSRCSRRYASPLVMYAPGVRLDVPMPREVIPPHVSLAAVHMVSVSRLSHNTCIFGPHSIASPYKSAPCSRYQQRIPLLLTLTQYQSFPLHCFLSRLDIVSYYLDIVLLILTSSQPREALSASLSYCIRLA
jgi:hypothetical protein